jgi:membrane-associated protein
MDPGGFIQQALNLVSDYTLQTALALFLTCLLSESLGFSIPLLLETVWLLAGCQVSQGLLSPLQLIALLAAAQAGRQLGAWLFYLLSRVTVGPLLRLFRWLTEKRFMERSAGLLNRLNLDSPFSVALGRLLYLRVPVTLVLAARRRPGTLALGVLLSSLVFDGVSLIIGAAAGSAARVDPWLLLLVLLAGLGAIYLLSWVARLSARTLLAARRNTGGEESSTHQALRTPPTGKSDPHP